MAHDPGDAFVSRPDWATDYHWRRRSGPRPDQRRKPTGQRRLRLARARLRHLPKVEGGRQGCGIEVERSPAPTPSGKSHKRIGFRPGSSQRPAFGRESSPRARAQVSRKSRRGPEPGPGHGGIQQRKAPGTISCRRNRESAWTSGPILASSARSYGLRPGDRRADPRTGSLQLPRASGVCGAREGRPRVAGTASCRCRFQFHAPTGLPT